MRLTTISRMIWGFGSIVAAVRFGMTFFATPYVEFYSVVYGAGFVAAVGAFAANWAALVRMKRLEAREPLEAAR